MINRYLYGSRLISIGGVVSKWFLMKDVVEFLCIFFIILTACRGKPRYFMRTRSLA